MQPPVLAHLLNTSLVSFSWPNSPKFLIAPAFGASSRGFAASAFRYARCKARTLVACEPLALERSNGRVEAGISGATNLLLMMQALIIVFQYWSTFPLSRVVFVAGIDDVAS